MFLSDDVTYQFVFFLVLSINIGTALSGSDPLAVIRPTGVSFAPIFSFIYS